MTINTEKFIITDFKLEHHKSREIGVNANSTTRGVPTLIIACCRKCEQLGNVQISLRLGGAQISCPNCNESENILGELFYSNSQIQN